MVKVAIKKLEELFEDDYEELSSLIETWKPEAQREETAVNALIKLMQQREQVAVKYYGIVPEEESQLEQFRKQREERKNKTTRKFKK